MNVKISRTQALKVASLASLIVAVIGCDSTSTSESLQPISAQAIDGYIVGGSVYCDDVASGGTTAAGQLVCPGGTKLIRVRGGADVGFDDQATSGAQAFVGELSAPGTLDYVTPMSTVAVAMSSESGVFDASSFDDSVELLAASLGLSSLDLNADASSTLQVIKLNAQINQILSSFSSTIDDYVAVLGEFAALARSNAEAGTPIALTTGVADTLEDLNAQLAASNPSLMLNAAELDVLSTDTEIVNTEIESAAEVELVALAATSDVTLGSALSIDRDIAPVGFYSYWNGFHSYTLKNYELDALVNGRYVSVVDTRYTTIYYGADAFSVDKTLTNANISLGFEFESTMLGDARKLSVTTSDALLTMTEGNSNSIEIVLPDSASFHARSVDSDGTISSAEFQVAGEKVFSATESGVGIRLNSLGSALNNQGHQDITRSTGNYKVTLVVSGIKVNMVDADDEYRATTYSVDSGVETVTGSGFQGYVSIVRF